MDKIFLEKYNQWLECAIDDSDLTKELTNIKNNENKIIDAFYKDLTFGTGGLRGVIGAGTNRMNIYVVRKATQGFANYLKKNFKKPSVAISFDSRIKSDLFAKESARVFAANNIHVYLYKKLMPTPCLSFAIRDLKCSGGIMVTASHNPSKYNGYKVYDENGCQITDKAAKDILDEINQLDIFSDVKLISIKKAKKDELISFVPNSTINEFYNRVLKETLLSGLNVNKNIKIVYSPLHGTGLIPVQKVLKLDEFNYIKVVKNQKKPDGRFKTCPYPNPEIHEAMQEGIKYAKKCNADLFFATDPDCDRIGIAIKEENSYTLLSGNQVGVLLFDFICKMRLLKQNMPENPIAVRSIVTTNMVDKIAKDYNVEIKTVLTGFKYIGDFINKLEKNGKEKSYIFGFEESYGYLSGSHVRDKDAVNGSLLIAEMFAYYKSQNKSLMQVLNELYEKYGFYLDKLDTFTFEGIDGNEKMSLIMSKFRNDSVDFGDFKIVDKLDYSSGIDDFPKSNVIQFISNNGSILTVRPSGTEPKIKIYYSIVSENIESSTKIYKELKSKLIEILK